MSALGTWLTHGEWVMAILTGIYVLFTGVYVLIAYFTLRAIHRQADIAEAQSRDALATATTAEKAAVAARDSADAVMNAERPWILVSDACLDSEFVRHSDDPEGELVPHFVVKFTITNVGKTPAIVHGFEGGIEGVGGDLRHEFQTLGDSWKGQARRVLGPGQEDELRFITQESFERIEFPQIHQGKSINKRLVAFGSVEYSDTFNKKHLSRFCFIHKPYGDRFAYFCHNPAHNQYT
jgi:hypothetical protein